MEWEVVLGKGRGSPGVGERLDEGRWKGREVPGTSA